MDNCKTVCGEGTPVKEIGQVESQVDRLASLISNLDVSIGELYSRLFLVVQRSPEACDDSNKLAEPCLCELANAIHQNCARLEKSILGLDELRISIKL